ncbi:MAG: tyrosine-type recombinase/integrase [Hyphomicrobiaceae bacterium]|nr:tyrosine-type recombinase/integrase [Hyphomicrobiaceae bacterium]
MASKINRLSSRKAATLDKPGRHADGAGLYLSISKSGGVVRRRWVFLFRWHGRLKEMGLGSPKTITLAEARELAGRWRRELNAGNNPLQVRAAEQRIRQTMPTFRDVATAYFEAKKHEWRNEKVRRQWMTPLERYGARLMQMPINEISTEDILAVLQPIWNEKAETARRVRQRIEAVMDAARARGLIAPDKANPARWKGHLQHWLAKHSKLSRGHLPAMPYNDVPAFISRLRGRDGLAAIALEFTILCGVRTSEALGATWPEIDFETSVWTIPPRRMKGGRSHRVPLSQRALDILRELYRARTSDLVFPGVRPGRPLSTMAMLMVLRRMGAIGATTHGFRSALRDWATDVAGAPREIAEAALSHVSGDLTERAYARSDALERRRLLMEQWAQFLEGSAATNVTPLQVAEA